MEAAGPGLYFVREEAGYDLCKFKYSNEPEDDDLLPVIV